MFRWKLQLIRETWWSWRPTYTGGCDWRSLNWLGLTLEFLWTQK